MKDFILFIFFVYFQKKQSKGERVRWRVPETSTRRTALKNDGKYVDSKAKVDITNKQTKNKSTELLIHKISS